MYISCLSRRNIHKKLFIFIIAFGLLIQVLVYFHQNRVFVRNMELKVQSASAGWSPADSPLAISEAGLLNHHVWYETCFENLQEFCSYPMFPSAPDNRALVWARDAFEIRRSKPRSVHRVFGFLEPLASGRYTFNLEMDGAVQLWLSIAEDSGQHVKSGTFSGLTTKAQSWTVDLLGGRKYFVDCIKMANAEETSFRVRLRQGKQPEYMDWWIFHPVSNDTQMAALRIYDETIPLVRACSAARDTLATFSNLDLNSRSFLEHTAVEKVLPSCRYNPSYNFHRKMAKWEAVSLHVVHTYRYPFPHSEALKDPKHWNFPLDETEVMTIVQLYLDKLEAVQPKKYRLLNVNNVERKKDTKHGKRYLIELELMDTTTEKAVTLSEYVFQTKDQDNLCYPENFQWNRTSPVYLVVTAKNQGRWLHHFIKNVEEILSETGDSNLHIVIFDYESWDIDVESVLHESSVTLYRVIKQPGRYSRTEAFTEAINSIPDPHAIVFMFDLHLDIHSSFIEDIRKHCIEGRSVYTPILVSLACGVLPSRPRGKWEVYGYGLIGLYKSDWDRVGGFPVQKHRWGGEDWELMDQLVGQGLEFERMRCPLLYHYYHSKHGMW